MRRGLYDYDSLSRKTAIQLIKASLKRPVDAKVLEDSGLTQKAFDDLWETFFEIFDTLDSYSSHLTKAIWDRMEKLYKYMKT